ncbi:hypothetical protein ANANG_G00310320 [Anguilla anguilla]|uniref:Vezatin n=1 Tax=Anguilla anguilla TaxID=7936 RepID=A0A9D3LKC2_ANGAN|nr:hypothetical protein ANANG_G00310320 [Anguilla anguilla]
MKRWNSSTCRIWDARIRRHGGWGARKKSGPRKRGRGPFHRKGSPRLEEGCCGGQLMPYGGFSLCIRAPCLTMRAAAGRRVSGRYSLRLLLEQDVFLQEDLELIELLDPGVLSVASASSLPAAPPGNRLLPSAWALWTLAVVVAVLAGLRSVWDGRGLSALVPWALALGGFLLVRGAGLWRAARLSGAMRAHGAQLESLAQDSQALTALIRKALRLIQETEVISRGFTLLLDRVSAACPFNRAENQLLGLRRASYQTLHTAFRAYRHATRHMLSAYPTANAATLPGPGAGALEFAPAVSSDSLTLCATYPLDSETDDAGNYLCTAPLGELGLGLGEGRPSDQRAQELTDAPYNNTASPHIQ